MKNNSKALRLGTYSIVICAVVLAVIIALNLFVSQLPSTFLKPDLSSDKLFSIGDDTLKVLKALDKDVDIYYILSSGAGEDSRISNLLERYEDSSSHIKVQKIDPLAQPTFISQFTDAELSDNSVIVSSELRNTCIDGSDFTKYEDQNNPGIYYTYEEYNYYNQYYGSYYQFDWKTFFFGESEITGAIDFVSQDEVPAFYELTGHGETSIINTAFGGIATDENIEIKPLTLAAGETSAVPEDAVGVLIPAPTSDITESEKEALVNYIDNGGKVVLFTFYENCTADEMPNLAAVCAYMGLEAVDGIIADNDQSHYSQYPYYLIPDITGNGVTSVLDTTNYYVFMPVCHGIEISGTTDDVETYELLQTSDQGYILDVNDAEFDPESAEKNIYSVAVQSANPTTKGELVWFASPNFVSDQFINYGNSNIFDGLLQNFTDKANSVSKIGKPVTFNSLQVSQSNLTTWTVVFAIVVVAILAAGITVYVVRRRK